MSGPLVGKRFVAVTALMFAMVLSGIAFGDIVTGFETSDNAGYVVGQTVAGVDGWKAKENADWMVISDDLPYAGEQSLRVGQVAPKVATTYREVDLDISAGVYPVLDVQIAVDSTNAPNEGLIYLGSGGNIGTANAAVQVWFDRNSGNLLYKDGASTMTIGAYTAGEYYHVRAEIDMQNYTFDLTVTGAGIDYSQSDIAFRNNMDSIEWVCINSWTNSSVNGGYIYVDNLSIVPEPGTCALLTGAAFLLGRRRRDGVSLR